MGQNPLNKPRTVRGEPGLAIGCLLLGIAEKAELNERVHVTVQILRSLSATVDFETGWFRFHLHPSFRLLRLLPAGPLTAWFNSRGDDTGRNERANILNRILRGGFKCNYLSGVSYDAHAWKPA